MPFYRSVISAHQLVPGLHRVHRRQLAGGQPVGARSSRWPPHWAPPPRRSSAICSPSGCCGPVAVAALRGGVPENFRAPGVILRQVLTWVLSTGVPVLAIVLALVASKFEILTAPADRLTTPILLLAIAALVIGLAGTVLVAMSIADPLRQLRWALGEVQRGNYNAHMQIYDASELGPAAGRIQRHGARSGRAATAARPVRPLRRRGRGPPRPGARHRARRPGTRRRRAFRRPGRLDAAGGDPSRRPRSSACSTSSSASSSTPSTGTAGSSTSSRATRRWPSSARRSSIPTPPVRRWRPSRELHDELIEVLGSDRLRHRGVGRPRHRGPYRRAGPLRVHRDRRPGQRGRPADRAGQAGGGPRAGVGDRGQRRPRRRGAVLGRRRDRRTARPHRAHPAGPPGEPGVAPTEVDQRRAQRLAWRPSLGGRLLCGGLLGRSSSRPSLDRAAGAAVGEQLGGALVGDRQHVVTLAQARVGLAVGDVRTEPAVLDHHRLAGRRVGAQLAQRRRRSALAGRGAWARRRSSAPRRG